MLTLYQAEWCEHCHRVRQALTELGLTYTTVNVAEDLDARADVMAVSDQRIVPVLQDGDKVYAGSNEIIEYLRAAYPEAPDAQAHADRSAWRAAAFTSLPPRAALAHLKELLEEKGFKVVAQIKGSKISERLPKEYTVLEVAVPVAALKVVSVDPTAVTAVLLRMAVMPVEKGSLIVSADPVGEVWLFGEFELLRVQGAVKSRLVEVFEKL